MLDQNAQQTGHALPHTLIEPTTVHLDEYTDHLQKICGRFAVEAREPTADSIRGSVRRTQISRFDTAVVALDAHRVVRNRAMIRCDPGDHLFLICQYRGQSAIIQNDRMTRLSSGDLYLVDSSVPSEFFYGARASVQVSLHLPREEMVSRLGQGCVGGQEISRNDPLTPAVRSVLGRMIAVEAEASSLGEALIYMLSAYFHARSRDIESVSTRLYRCALRKIEANAPDGSFGIESLASELGVSRRTLQRVFSEHGDAFSVRLRTIRLEMARSRLLGGQPNIAAVAYECGFNDLSSFYRQFNDRFGVAPGRLREGRTAPKPRLA